ncbi:MAG: DNA polymerase I [Marinilabiliales bacterium]
MGKKIFLLDAYALIFRAYYAFIKNPRRNSKGLNTSAMFGFTNTLLDVLNKEQPSHIAVAIDYPGPNFRNDIFPDYKANRPPTPEDIKLAVPYIKKILEAFHIPVFEIQGYEADDTLGTLSKIAANKGFEVYLMTPDKDFAQLVNEKVYLYKPGRSGNDARILGVNEVLKEFGIKSVHQVLDIFALSGDSVDNIPGAPGIGPKTAQKLIEKYDSIENLYNHLNELKGKQKEILENNKDKVFLSKKLVTINQNVPLNFDENKTKIKSVDLQKITELFQELEFRNLLERVKNFSNENKTTANYPLQGVLFQDEPQINKITNAYSTIDTVEHEYIIADDELKRKNLIHELSNTDNFCFDTETTGLDPNRSEIVGMSFSFQEKKSYYVPLPSNQVESQKILNDFKPVFENENIAKTGQNLKFDILLLKWYGINVKGNLFDTMIAHYLINPEQKHNLDFLAEKYLNYSPVKIENLIGPKGKNQKSMRNVSIEKVAEYAAEDADITWQLKNLIFKELESKGLYDLYNKVEKDLIYVLADMEKTGVKINTLELKRLGKEMKQELIRLEDKIYNIAGEKFNISSPKQLGIVLFDKLKLVSDAKKTKTKQYSTSEDTLLKIKDKHEIVQLILEYRSVKKLLSTYVETLPKEINPRTGKIHTSFNQARVATGRLSSDKPNLQNIPIREERGKAIRKVFIPSSDDRVFLSADYSQVELRLMAHLSQDEGLIDAFRNNEDIHTATAAKIFNVSPDKVNRDMRSRAKSVNFGIIYGISAFGLSQNINISRSEAKEFIENYFKLYPKVKEYMDKAISIAREKGYVETIFGRRRILNDINSRNPVVRGIAERNAINAPIQGSAADIIKIAMINIYKQFENKKLKSKMILQVHDELDFDVYKSEVDIAKEIIIKEMQDAVNLSVPLIAEVGIGNNWLEAH